MTRYKLWRDKEKTHCLSREIAGCTFPINQNAVRPLLRFRAHAYWRRNFAITFIFCAYSRAKRICDRAESFVAQSYPCVVIDFEPLNVWDTRVITRIYTYMYVSMPLCDSMFHPGLLLPSASELLHLVFTQLLTRTCHTSIEILICWAFFPLFVAHASCRADDTLPKVKPARHVYITASLSISFRESVLLPNLSHLVGIAKPFVLRAQLRFLLIILLSILLFSLYLSFSLHLSASFLYLSLHSLRFARGKDSFVSRLSRENERKRFQVEH